MIAHCRKSAAAPQHWAAAILVPENSSPGGIFAPADREVFSDTLYIEETGTKMFTPGAAMVGTILLSAV